MRFLVFQDEIRQFVQHLVFAESRDRGQERPIGLVITFGYRFQARGQKLKSRFVVGHGDFYGRFLDFFSAGYFGYPQVNFLKLIKTD